MGRERERQKDLGEKDRWRQEEKREEEYRVYVGETRTNPSPDRRRGEGWTRMKTEVKERKTLKREREEGKNTEPPVVVTCGTSSEEFIVER